MSTKTLHGSTVFANGHSTKKFSFPSRGRVLVETEKRIQQAITIPVLVLPRPI